MTESLDPIDVAAGYLARRDYRSGRGPKPGLSFSPLSVWEDWIDGRLLFSTNNGTCLDSNYNWPTCMTYQQAGDALKGAVSDLHQRYGSRLAQLFIFEQRDMTNNPTGREGNFGAVKTDGSPKGAFFNAIQSLVNTYRG